MYSISFLSFFFGKACFPHFVIHNADSSPDLWVDKSPPLTQGSVFSVTWTFKVTLQQSSLLRSDFLQSW